MQSFNDWFIYYCNLGKGMEVQDKYQVVLTTQDNKLDNNTKQENLQFRKNSLNYTNKRLFKDKIDKDSKHLLSKEPRFARLFRFLGFCVIIYELNFKN